jgi:signal transduction histidine kinase/ActR/RegA family two-component response regulator
VTQGSRPKRGFSGPGIWGKLLASYFTLSLVPLLVLGYIMYNVNRNEIMTTERQGLSSLVDMVGHRIDAYVDGLRTSTVLMARLEVVRELTRAITAGDASARLRLSALLRGLASGEAQIDTFFVLHPETGEVLASSDAREVGKFFDKRAYFQTGRELTQVHRAHYAIPAGRNIIATSTPMRSSDGRLLGVVLSWTGLEKFRQGLDLPRGARVYLVNRAQVYLMGAEDAGGIPILTGLFTEPVLQALAGKSGSGVYPGLDGTDAVTAYAPVPSVGLALVAEEPLAQVLASVHLMRWRLLLALLPLTVLVFVVSLAVSRRISAPLVKMSEGARAIASGRFDHRVDHDAHDELGQLARSMNRMAASLENRERELRDLIGTLNTVVDHMSEGVALLDRDGFVVLANGLGREYLKLLSRWSPGSAVKALAGRPVSALLATAHKAQWHEIAAPLAEGDEAPSGRIFMVSVRMTSDAGEVSGMVVTIADVTQERQVQQRAQSQEKLAAMGQLASGIAHDFSNILTTIIGFSEMLLTDRSLAADVRAQLDAIHQSGLRASGLITQIMDFSRGSTAEMRTVDVHVIVDEFVHFIRRTLPESIQITLDAPPSDVLLARADVVKLQQVLTNLAVNARDAMQGGGTLGFALFRVPGGGPLPLTGTPAPMPGPWVVLVASDTGTGIDEETLPYVFDPFFTTKGQGKGTGLGLSQVYGIVQQHGGLIEVTSTPGSGTAFVIALPEAATGGAAEPEASLPAPDEVPHGSGQTILIVEDATVVHDMLVVMLTSLGYRVIGAPDAQAALALFRERGPEVDLVLTDMVMPGMDGVEMARRMREQEGSRVPVVVVSGYPADSVKGSTPHELASAGVVNWITKPFKPADLATALHDALTNRA